jgi:N-acetylglucosaminyldiphosphoundecaprenol N-acetyl-beta-D-mannosaminyltransferase
VNKLSKQTKILTLNINNIKMQELIEQLIDIIQNNNEKKLIYTPNSEIVVRAYDDPAFSELLNQADFLVPDGAGLLLAARLIGDPLQERVAGFDLMRNLLKQAADKDISFYFLGGKPGIIDSAVNNIKSKLPELNMAGFHHGYLDQDLTESVIKDINEKQPDILLVGMGVPRQEKFFSKYFDELQIKVGLTVGGSFDVWAGQVDRAPLWMQKLYLEWFYRLLQEPTRWKRMMAIPRFIYLVLKEKINT